MKQLFCNKVIEILSCDSSQTAIFALPGTCSPFGGFVRKQTKRPETFSDFFSKRKRDAPWYNYRAHTLLATVIVATHHFESYLRKNIIRLGSRQSPNYRPTVTS